VTGSTIVSTGGGKSGFRRINPLLHRLFEDPFAKLRREVSDLLLAASNPLPVRSVVDSLDHGPKIGLHLLLETIQKLF
jgi:hypothetical protein